LGHNLVVKKVIVLAVAALALLPAANAASQRTARLVIVDISPFTVHGSGFAAGERVTITVQTKQRFVRTKAADTRGTFTARFWTVSIPNCSSYVVRAVGNRGSVATKKVIPECATPGPSGEEPAPMYPTDPTPKKTP
jgi:hypothetical protein